MSVLRSMRLRRPSTTAVDVVESSLAAIALDIGRDFDSLTLRPPDHPERRTYLKRVEALGLVEAVCEEQGDGVVVIRLRVEAFA
jgi:hypothetical protein